MSGVRQNIKRINRFQHHADFYKAILAEVEKKRFRRLFKYRDRILKDSENFLKTTGVRR